MSKALMIQGTSSGAGKTTLVTALCRIFANSGYRVAPFKSQNMSSFSYKENGFEISRAQAIQAIAARTEIDPRMNPILLMPLGNYRSKVLVKGKFYKKMYAKDYYEKFALSKGLKAATESLDWLQQNYDLIIIEGAGSPAEFNLEKYDIANMRMAEYSGAPVVLVADIDKGGSFASIVGTMELIDQKYRKFIKGFVINKFRGDMSILRPSLKKLRQKTNRPILGTIPLLKLDIPEEDSLHANPKQVYWNKKYLQHLDMEIENLSRIVKASLNMKAIGRLIQ
ncbi:MAG TPA: cobyric acid synthase [Nitrosopumilaceae archaeon]|nr:cobyric acid synthase [Nitrosopumilaceae archaeon]